MTTNEKSSGSSVLQLLLRTSSSSSQRAHNHHQRSAASFCNIRLDISPRNIPKRKCLCSPSTHPGSFRCAYHRRLENQKPKTLVNTSTGNGGLNLKKLALMNSLAKIGCVASETLRKSLAATLLKPSSPDIPVRSEFRPRPSRFYAMHKDQN